VSQLHTAGLITFGAAAANLAQSIPVAADDPVWTQGIIITVGVAVFMFFDRRERATLAIRNTERRDADVAKDERIKQLEEDLAHKTAELIEELRKHTHTHQTMIALHEELRRPPGKMPD